MNGISMPRVFLYLVCIAVLSLDVQAQTANPGITAAPPTQGLPSNVISFSDTLPSQPDGAITVTFSLYPDQQSTTATWVEDQVVQVVGGKYTVLLGSATTNGISPEVFAADQAHWLGVQINGTEKRYLLVSVPYAMKALEADRLGGLGASQYVTQAQLQSLLQSSGSGSTTATGTGTTGIKTSTPTTQAAASGTPPQPATDFTDNNSSEVLLVTQQGTGFAIHAISAGDAAVFGENNTPTGTGLKGLASSTTGANIGILGSSASSGGIAGVFDNTGGGQILSLRANGNEVASVDNGGNIKGNQVQANIFAGNGGQLFNIPNSATTATTSNTPNSIVQRDGGGGISASYVNSNFFSGNGGGLFNIPNSATTATTLNTPDSIVLRDSGGGISVAYLNSNFISGNGGGLFNIPNSATTATTSNTPNSIVQRDGGGGISVAYLNSNFISGNGGGLFNIPNSATTATISATPNSIVLRDNGGGISANYVNSNFFSGNGGGLFNIPNSATTATSDPTANTIVARDANGNLNANSIFALGLNVGQQGIRSGGVIDFTSATTTPVHAVLSANTPAACTAGTELLIKTDATPGQQLFICNAMGNGYVLVGDGNAAGVTSVSAGDGSVSIGGTAAAPTVEVANGGITSAKLAPNAVTGSIADGSLTPAKIAGTAATLGSNTFGGSQTIQQNLTVSGKITNNGGITTSSILSLANPNVMSIGGAGTALSVSGGNVGIAISGSSTAMTATADFGNTVTAQNTTGTALQGSGPVGVDAVTATGVGLQARATGSGGTAAIFSSLNPGKLISGRSGITENFSVDSSGNVFAAGTLGTQFPNDKGIGTVQFVLAELTPAGAVVRASDQAGIVGIVVSGAGISGNAQVAYSGIATCAFHTTTQAGDYVQNWGDGFCKDVGPQYPSTGQVLGRVAQTVGITESVAPVFLYGPEQHSFLPGVATINTGSGLTGGPITSSGTISIANGGVTNSMLQNSAVTVNPGLGLSGGGTVPLGSSVTLNNTGVVSFQGRTGNVVPAANDYSFSQLSGAVSPTQLPPTVVYNNANNNLTGRQVISGSFAVNDTSAANGSDTLAVFSQNNVAGAFLSSGPVVFLAQSSTSGGAISLAGDGTFTATGNVFGASFIGDGSRLTSVNAASVGGVTSANLATTSALASETTARQSGDAALATSINAETASRQTADNNLQSSINSVSAADAKLASPNTFTASNTFTAGTQDFSAAGATLPVRALTSVQTPATCVAGKELLIKTDAPAGQQLFICDASGTSWNLVGDGASGGVASFNGRNGSVSPASGDYSFSQISGSVGGGQMPALSGDVTSAAGSTITTLAPSGVTAGSYSKVGVDAKGRVISGSQLGFADVAGSATQGQLPSNVVYNNQANTFSAGQTVNGTLSATLFAGNGGGLSNVNAATLNGQPSASFAQLGTDNTFVGNLTASSFTGSGSGLTNVNATKVNNFQMLKFTAAVSPASVGSQTCSEQTFNVAGVSAGDVILSVLQPSTSSPGTNIAIGGWRVSAANTVAIQFCNVSRSNSTPTSGTYTFALMR